MKMKLTTVMMAGVLAAGISVNQSATAQTVESSIFVPNSSVTPINGTGNESTGWDLETVRYSGDPSGIDAIKLGFMAEYSKPGYPNNATAPADPNNGSGTFVFPQGNQSAIGGNASRSQFDLWFSVEVEGGSLETSDLSYYWSILAPGSSTWTTPINLLSYPDNSYGTSSTLAGGGGAETASSTIGQNAQDPVWIDPSYNVNGTGQIDVEIFAVSSTDKDPTVNSDGSVTGSLGMLDGTVDVGVSPVPEPSTYAMAGMGCLSLFGFNRFRRKTTA